MKRTGRDVHSGGRRLWVTGGCLLLPLLVMAFVLPAAIGAGEAPGAGESQLSSMRIDGFYDPDRGFIEATARLRFKSTAGKKPLWLANDLQLSSIRGGIMTLPPFASESGLFMVQCPEESELELNYSGRLSSVLDPLLAALTDKPSPGADDCRILSHVQDYYPHPQTGFTAMEMNVRVPGEWSCLGSGTLSAMKRQPGVNEFTFQHPACKGISLVFGRFQQIGLLAGPVPIRLHAWPGFDFRQYYNDGDLLRLLAFYQERFGPLPVPELSVLFRRGDGFMGVSYSGLIILNVDDARKSGALGHGGQPQEESLMAMADAGNDLLAHEMAHQWWGGVVTWESAADNWITEGLATYSSLMYLRERCGEKAYRRACKRFLAGLKRYAQQGVPADGAKLKRLCRDPRVYQALVYIKPALMLVELADAVGEGEVVRRLRALLDARRSRTVGGDELLSVLAAGDPDLRTRLQEWIFVAGLPGDPGALKK